MENPLISVIVPIYNVEMYLNRCVESIVNQTYHNLEIILVDDGSPDNCPKMCEDWANRDKRIKVIHKDNGGLSDARNAGMKIAAGEYISFVDSDDLVDSRFIELLYDAVSSTGSELAACDVISFYQEQEIASSNMIPECIEYTPEGALSQLIKGRGFRAVAWNKLYHSELIKNERFEYGKLHEDEFFTYRILDKCSKLAYIYIPLYFYRQREGSIMSVQAPKRLDGLEAGFQRLCFFKAKYPLLYKKDIVIYCKSCLNSYCNATFGDNEYRKHAKKIIRRYRKQVKIPLSVWMNYRLKDKLYITLSSPLLIDLYAFIKRIKR